MQHHEKSINTEDFFVIDPDRLLEQWSTFARNYYKRACELAEARAEWERMKRVRDVVEAELDKEIRLNPEEYGISIVREKSVERTILLDKKYRQADEEVIKAKHSLDIHQAFVDAMDAMKKGLESTAYLQQASYHAEPQAKGNAQSYISDAKIDRALGTRKSRE